MGPSHLRLLTGFSQQLIVEASQWVNLPLRCQKPAQLLRRLSKEGRLNPGPARPDGSFLNTGERILSFAKTFQVVAARPILFGNPGPGCAIIEKHNYFHHPLLVLTKQHRRSSTISLPTRSDKYPHPKMSARFPERIGFPAAGCRRLVRSGQGRPETPLPRMG